MLNVILVPYSLYDCLLYRLWHVLRTAGYKNGSLVRYKSLLDNLSLRLYFVLYVTEKGRILRLNYITVQKQIPFAHHFSSWSLEKAVIR